MNELNFLQCHSAAVKGVDLGGNCGGEGGSTGQRCWWPGPAWRGEDGEDAGIPSGL